MVFGVCALGVSALYVAPSIARSPHQVPRPIALDRPTATPAPLASSDAPDAGQQPGTDDTGAEQPSESLGTAVGTGGAPSGETTERPLDRDSEPTQSPTPAAPSSRAATPFDPNDPADRTAPEPVSSISVDRVTEQAVTLRWPAARDDIAVVGYRVWINSFEVATTVGTSATVQWLQAEAGQQVVQVRAMDAAGNQSEQSPTVLVVRPTPSPTPAVTEPTPEPSTTQTPTTTPTPAPSSEPTPSPSTMSDPTSESTTSDDGARPQDPSITGEEPEQDGAGRDDAVKDGQ